MASCFKISVFTTVLVAIVSISVAVYWRYSDTREFNYGTTADEAANNMNLAGKIIIVTGSNTGIGKPTARVLLSNGASVIMACRNMEKAKAAQQDIIQQIIDKDPAQDVNSLRSRLDLIPLDLGSFASIDTFAETFLNKYDALDYLVLNAGLQQLIWSPTADGIEQTFGVNHVGHYYLAKLLTPLLIKTAHNGAIGRVVSVSSYAQIWSPKPLVDWLQNDSFIQDASRYNFGVFYGLSKACNILFAKEYNERYRNNNVYSVSLHPGSFPSELVRDWHPIIQYAYNVIVGGTFLKTTEQGAATTIRTLSLSDDEFKAVGGSYFSDCNQANHDVRTDLFPDGVKEDEMPQKLLWKLTEDVIIKYK